MTQCELPLILDPCCGPKGMWFEKEHDNVIFGDIRKERRPLCDGRVLNVDPDLIMDFTNIPFPENHFNLVVFDPPHLARAGDKSWLKAKYGRLEDGWQGMIKDGFSECFRVLKPGGVLIFKWNETQIPVRDILNLTAKKALFGNRSGSRSKTHWIVFMKD